jgi:outer membrane receptor protein involved in Fe transport
MMTSIARICTGAALLAAGCLSQGTLRAQAPGTTRDTTLSRELPRLEIPEITIVGKKAITLPFARKGEIYDVPLYDAPPPDSSLLTDRPPVDLPGGSLPRYEQREMPWRVSAEASAGRFGSLGLRGYVDYHTQAWNLSTTGGYRRTDGHVDGSSGNEFDVGGRYTSLVSTDNDLLRNFRVSGDLGFRHDAFGMYGMRPAGTDRDRDMYSVGAGVSSIRRSGLVFDFSVGAEIFSVDDKRAGIDSGITVTTPLLKAGVTADVGIARVITEFRYTNSSLDYQNSLPSPSLYTIVGAVQWRISESFFIKTGGEFSGGTGTDEVSRTRVSPLAELEWQINPGRKVNFWFRPGMTLTSYPDLAGKIPYIAREVMMIPEEKTIDLGGSVWYNSGMLTLEAGGEYIRSTNRPLIVADTTGIHPEFAGTWQTILNIEGSLRASEVIRLDFNGRVSPAREQGGSSQLPMTPLGEAGVEAGFDFIPGWTFTAASRYWYKQNTGRNGAESIGGAFLVDAGASTDLIPHVLISAGIHNIFDRKYSWWAGYPARGLDLFFTVKARL